MEQTEAERMQKKHEEQLADQRAQSDHQFQVAMKMQEVRTNELRQGFEERRKELEAQNDGLLGAVGRMHRDNESLKGQVSDLEAQLVALQNECKLEVANIRREAEMRHVEMLNEVSESRTHLLDENKRLQTEVQKLRDAKKKK